MGCMMDETEWLACSHPEPMLRFLRGIGSSRQLRLFAAACCRRIWNYLLDERSKRAVNVIEQYADALADDEELRRVGNEAEQAYRFLKRRALASVVGVDLASQAAEEARGLFGLTDNDIARGAHDVADNDPYALAASAVWSATAFEAELNAVGYDAV